MNATSAATAYARVGLESGVLAASPERLISMLFDGALAAIRDARRHLARGDAARRGQAVSKALDIVNHGLAAALDHERGGELAEQLAGLYDYVARRLLAANLHGDDDGLAEAAGLLEAVASAWREMAAVREGG